MKIFLDTANVEEIKRACSFGVVDGVTTNPSLVSKEGKSFKELLKDICEIVQGPVSAEVVSTDKEGIIREARELSSINEQIVVKIPMIKEGVKAISELSKEGIKINCTLIFNPLQAYLAAKAGAYYVSPFVGRLDDIGHDGMELVHQVLTIFENYQFQTRVIVASIRHPNHVLQSALIGAHIATIPYNVFEKMFNHPLTDKGLEKFLSDWEKLKEKI